MTHLKPTFSNAKGRCILKFSTMLKNDQGSLCIQAGDASSSNNFLEIKSKQLAKNSVYVGFYF